MIEIQNLEILNKGALICKFNAKFHKLGGMIIRRCVLFEANGRRWINLPSEQYESDGKKKYFAYVCFEERSMDDKFKEKIMVALLEQLKKQEQPIMKQPDLFEDQGELPF